MGPHSSVVIFGANVPWYRSSRPPGPWGFWRLTNVNGPLPDARACRTRPAHTFSSFLWNAPTRTWTTGFQQRRQSNSMRKGKSLQQTMLEPRGNGQNLNLDLYTKSNVGWITGQSIKSKTRGSWKKTQKSIFTALERQVTQETKSTENLGGNFDSLNLLQN